MKIKNLLFDFGEVLVTLSREKAVAAFRALGAEIADEIVPASWSFDGMFRDLENGKITEREFFDNLNFSLGLQATDEELRAAWNAIIQDIPLYKLDLLLALRKNYSVYMVSNTNKIHMDYTKEHLFKDGGHTIDDFFDKLYLSYEIGASKPEKAFFDYVIKDVGLKPEETLYLDDSPANIEAGWEMGFRVCPVSPLDDLDKLVEACLHTNQK